MARFLTRRGFVSAIGAGAALFGSGGASGAGLWAIATPTVGSVPGATYPSGWDPKKLERTIQAFIGAVNDGDQATLSRFIPAKSGTWDDWTPDQLLAFSISWSRNDTTEVGHFTTRDDILAYFAARHEQRERWRLVGLSVGPAASEALYFQALIERTANDAPSTPGVSGGVVYIRAKTLSSLEVFPAPQGLMSLAPPFTGDASAPPSIPASVEQQEMPAGCDAATLAKALQRFFRSFNAGDAKRLGAFIPRSSIPMGSVKHGIAVYGVSDYLGASAGDIVSRSYDEIMAYFAARHRKHERQRLVALPQVSWDGRTNAVGFVPYIARWADDVAPHITTGKMAMFCPGFQIQVWNQGALALDVPKLTSG